MCRDSVEEQYDKVYGSTANPLRCCPAGGGGSNRTPVKTLYDLIGTSSGGST